MADYWIVDADARLVDWWRPGDERPAILETSLEWWPNPSLEPLVIDLPGYFAEVWGEEPPR